MASERVADVLRRYEAINAGRLEAAIVGADPEFEMIPPQILPDIDDAYHGPEAFLRFWRTWQEAFDDFRLEVEETIDAGDQVIVMARLLGTGKDSGVEVNTPSFPLVWSFEDGRVVRMEAFQTRAMAMESLGLDPERGGGTAD